MQIMLGLSPYKSEKIVQRTKYPQGNKISYHFIQICSPFENWAIPIEKTACHFLVKFVQQNTEAQPLCWCLTRLPFLFHSSKLVRMYHADLISMFSTNKTVDQQSVKTFFFAIKSCLSTSRSPVGTLLVM